MSSSSEAHPHYHYHRRYLIRWTAGCLVALVALSQVSFSSIKLFRIRGESSSLLQQAKDHQEFRFKSTNTSYNTTRFFSIAQDQRRNSTTKADENSNENTVSAAADAGGLFSCVDYGGPDNKLAASEMMYWKDIPSDALFVSPYKKLKLESSTTHTHEKKKQYLTFEPDFAGWNNLRMSMETVVVLAYFMGRTLVLPPQQGMLRLDQKQGSNHQQKNRFTFADFFPFDSLAEEHQTGIEVISTEEFLKREVMTGNLVHPSNSSIPVPLPPDNRTNWDGMTRHEGWKYAKYARSIGLNLDWSPDRCMVAFLKDPSHDDGISGNKQLQEILDNVLSIPMEERARQLQQHIPAVNASIPERLMERLAHRTEFCFYNSTLYNAPVLHVTGSKKSRMVVHFYAFLFFQDWRHEQWTKRFVRDHLRYVDEIQCAAARVVQALRDRARKNGCFDGAYDSFHIRRGDFELVRKDTIMSAEEIYETCARDVIPEKSTIYMASDERDQDFFRVFRKHYKVYFLEDFRHLLQGVNTNYYPMVDQLVAARSRTFVGTYYSTFSAYINRLRGYHSWKDKSEGFEKGIINSYYFKPQEYKLVMRQYRPIIDPIWAQEFSVAWRDVDRGGLPEQ